MINIEKLRPYPGPKIDPPWAYLVVRCDVDFDGVPVADMHDVRKVHFSGHVTLTGFLSQATLYIPGFWESEQAISAVRKFSGLNLTITKRCDRQFFACWVHVKDTYLGHDIFDRGLAAYREQQAKDRLMRRVAQVKEAMDGATPEEIQYLRSILAGEK